MTDKFATLSPPLTPDSGESLFPVTFYSRVQEIIESFFSYPRSVEQIARIEDVLSLFAQFIYVNHAQLYLLDKESEQLKLHFGLSINDKDFNLGRYDIGEGVTGKAFLDQNVVYIKDISSDPDYLGRILNSSDFCCNNIGYIAVPFIGKVNSGVLAFHLGERSPADVIYFAAIAYFIADKIGHGELQMT